MQGGSDRLLRIALYSRDEPEPMNESRYTEMLDALLEKLPEKSATEERFRIPRPVLGYEGRRSIIVNFKEITKALRRDPKLMTTFLSKEVAAPGVYDEPRLIVQARLDMRTLQSVLEKFLRKYVICPACGGPDTQLTRVKRILTLKCDVCGTETSAEAM